MVNQYTKVGIDTLNLRMLLHRLKTGRLYGNT